MKIKNSYIKLILWMALGGVVGACLGFGLTWSTKRAEGEGLAKLANAFIGSTLWMQILVWLVLMGLSFILLRRVKKWTPGYEDEEDSTEKKIGVAQNQIVLLTSINMALQFMLFGVGLDERNPYIMASVAFFIVGAASSSFIEIAMIKQAKALDPLKKGDPADLRFTKRWEESCDEAEKLMMYRCGFHTLQLMKTVMLVAVAVALICKTQWGTGNLPIVLTATLWMIQNISYCLFCFKEN